LNHNGDVGYWQRQTAIISDQLRKQKVWLQACDRKRKLLQTLCINYDGGSCLADKMKPCKVQCADGHFKDEEKKILVLNHG